MLKLAIFIFTFSSIGLLSSQLIPLFLNKAYRLQDKKVGETEKKLDTMFIRVNKERIFLFYTLTPLVLGLFGFLFFHHLLFVLLGVGLGSILPKFILNSLQTRRKARFQAQIVDALMILSSSLKSGLSLLQALEVLTEEMPAPMSDEIGLVVRENKMGITLEDSLRHLDQRIHREDLTLVVNSILVARETGGDLTKVFSRLSTTIRDNRKLKDSIKTLTMQGRLQGIIMSALPFFFVFGVSTFNRQHFDIMLQSEVGRMLLLAAVVLQVIGMILIRKFSTIRI